MVSRRNPTLAFAALLALAAAACSEEPAPFEETPAAPQAARLPEPNIMAVQNRHTPDLMRRDGIIGTGIRLAETGSQKIVVYAVTPSHAAAARIPRQLEGYDVEVVATGRIDAGDINNPQTRERPAPNGFSVGHFAITAGTIGAKVTKGSNTYILSNNHVLANSNNASIGDAILQPGPYDGGTSADRIGTLAEFQTIVMGGSSNTMDAAIALVNEADLLGITPEGVGYGAPGTTPVNASLNMSVQKFGRTTGHTTGTVAEVNVTVTVCYVPRGMFSCAQAATFTGQIGISPGTFSAGGDSGSLIVTNNSSKSPVGLLFAGSSTRTLANPIAPVLSRFGVAIDTDGGSSEPPPPGPDETAPNAAFSVSCNKNACTFTDQSTDNVGVTSWLWNLGNGTSTQRNASRTYTAAGSYPVSLTVSDAAGNNATANDTVNCSVRGKQLRCS